MTALQLMDWQVEPATEKDREGIFEIFHEVVKQRDTYLYYPDTPFEKAMQIMVDSPNRCFVVRHEGKVIGFCSIRPNREGYGNHVANASYMVRDGFRGQGVAKAMCAFSLKEAKREGYLAMQFNFVVSTNTPAVDRWKKMGFEILATIPKAYRHSAKGLVDAYLMYRFLDDIEV